MKLEKFKQRDFKKIGIIIFTVVCVLLVAGVFFYASFASFQTQQEFNIIHGTVGSNGDLYFAFYVDDIISKTMPQKNEGYVLDKEKTNCTKGASVAFNVERWSVRVLNMTEKNTKCTLYFKKGYSETILNGTDPVLEDPLIPVTIEADGTVKRADLESEWYSYANKSWANAVILTDESTNSNYEPGDTIPEEAIESYFVWIPKYRYQLWDLGQYNSLTSIDESKVHEIPIIFGDYNTSDDNEGECTTPMTSGSSGNCTVEDYMTHPAFISIPSTGFWMGKYETGYRGATNTTSAAQNINDPNKVIIKPNTYSWRGIQVANAFYTSYDYQRNLDSHMMKNTEWGAVAYLQHSAYGSQVSVRINNNSSYATGYAANNEPTCGSTGGSSIACNTHCNDGTCNTSYPNSVNASTTENITGIYDMSGSVGEYVMGVMMSSDKKVLSGRNSSSNSGFKGIYSEGGDNDNGYDWPDKKYYDTYLYGTMLQLDRRILGDATGEVGPYGTAIYGSLNRTICSWHKNGVGFYENRSPWLMRGGVFSSGSEAGVFSIGGTAAGGGVNSAVGFRLVLTPSN